MVPQRSQRSAKPIRTNKKEEKKKINNLPVGLNEDETQFSLATLINFKIKFYFSAFLDLDYCRL